MAQKLNTNAVVTVASAGTAVAVNTTETPVTSVVIVAGTGNTNNIYVGDSTVSAANGIPLAAGKDISLGSDDIPRQADELFLNDIFIDTDTNGNTARVAFIKRR